MRLSTLLPEDPRYLQIAFLGSFLVLGVEELGFDVAWWQPVLLAASALGTQWGLARLLGVPAGGWQSPLISSLGLALLLRTDAVWVVPLAAGVAVGSKFLLRVRGKHLFNPTNLGLVVCLLATGHAWCSPSQWGHSAARLGWFAALGLAVAYRAFRSDVSLAFLGTWVGLKAARVLYLGAPLESLWHQLSTGSLLLFTFFMISDPRTTPDHRVARVVYGAGVAVLGLWLLHGLWWQNALLWALALASPVVPLMDRLLPAERFEWPGTGAQQRKDTCTRIADSSPSSQPA